MFSNAHKKEVIWSIYWLLGLIFTYLLFIPVTMGGDWFVPILSVYFYLGTTLLFVWIGYLIKKPIFASFPVRLTKLALVIAFFFPFGSYFYNGRMGFIRNAAANNYPLVLNILLDSSNQRELNIALAFAEYGKNQQIIEDLKSKGAISE